MPPHGHGTPFFPLVRMSLIKADRPGPARLVVITHMWAAAARETPYWILTRHRSWSGRCVVAP